MHIWLGVIHFVEFELTTCLDVEREKSPFKVLGVLKERGESGGFGSRDDMICIPYTTAMRRLQGIDYIQSIDVRAVSADALDDAVAQIEDVLRNRHRIAPGAEDDVATAPRYFWKMPVVPCRRSSAVWWSRSTVFLRKK